MAHKRARHRHGIHNLLWATINAFKDKTPKARKKTQIHLNIGLFARSATLLDTLLENLLQALAVLESLGVSVVGASLPGRSAEVFDAVGILEHFVDLLEGLAGRLGKHEEHVDGHGDAEDGENDVSLPFDLHERWRHEVAESEIECPVTRS